jgi:isovaleryl-CoA dehydrogenase
MNAAPGHNDIPNPLALTEDYQAFYDAAFRYAKEKLHPLLAKMDDDDWYPPTLMRDLGRDGFVGITAPAEYGGAGLDLFSAALVGEAFGYWNTNAGCIWGPHENLCLNNILRNGTEAQKLRYLPRLCSGEWVGALGLTEPGAGSDALGGMSTVARREGDHYLLTGRKMFISNGPVADVMLIYAKTAPERGPKGISAFIVESSFPGFSAAQKLRKMGWRGAPTGELVFDDCRVPAENLLGTENQGVAIVMSGLDIERAFLAAPVIGASQRCLDLALEYVTQRKQFGRPIADFQLVQAKLADMYTEIEAARLLVYKAVAACNTLEQGGGGRGDIHRLCAAAILKAARVNMLVVDHAVQLHGGLGFMWDSEINRHYRNAKVAEIGGGTNEIRQLIIAEELLRGYRR